MFLHPQINVLEAVWIIPLQLSLLSKTSFPLSTLINDNFSQSKKASELILLTLLGIKMDVKLLHSMKAYWPILVTLTGIFIETKFEHLAKALSGILVNP